MSKNEIKEYIIIDASKFTIVKVKKKIIWLSNFLVVLGIILFFFGLSLHMTIQVPIGIKVIPDGSSSYCCWESMIAKNNLIELFLVISFIAATLGAALKEI